MEAKKVFFDEKKNISYVYVDGKTILTSDNIPIPTEDFNALSPDEYYMLKSTIDEEAKYNYDTFIKTGELVHVKAKRINIAPAKVDPFTQSIIEAEPKLKPSVNTSKPEPVIATPTEEVKPDTPMFEKPRMGRPIGSRNKTREERISELKTEMEKLGWVDNSLEFEQLKQKNKELEEELNNKPTVEPVIEKPINVPEEIVNKPEEVVPEIEEKKPFLGIDWYAILLKIIVIGCSGLSIYFTGAYVQKLQIRTVAYTISCCMLFYGLIGSQAMRKAFSNKKFLRGLLFFITSAVTIGFSMFTSLDVNYTKYMANHQEIVRENKQETANVIEFKLLQEEREENKEQITKLNEDIAFQQTQTKEAVIWTVDEEHPKGYNKPTGRYITTKAADEAIAGDKSRIEELTARNKEINDKLRELAQSGTDIEAKVSQKEAAKSLTELIGVLTGLGGNTVQMMILVLPSIFIDLVNILSLTLLSIHDEEKKKKRQ